MCNQQESTISHEGHVALKYTFTSKGHSVEFLKDIIEQLDSNQTDPPSDDYTYALQYREVLFNLKEQLNTYVRKIFKKLQKDLVTDLKRTVSISTFCQRKCNDKDKISSDYDFKNWENDEWKLAKFFSPTLARNWKRDPLFEIDIQCLLEILEQFKDFEDDVRPAAHKVKIDRNILYAHLSGRGITHDQFKDAHEHVNMLRDLTINIHN